MNILQRKKSIVLIFVFLLALALPTAAQMTREPQMKALPPQLSDIGIEQRLNQQIPLDLAFRDESGRTVQLRQYFNNGRPVILSLVYFECPMMCTEVLNSLTSALKVLKFDVGKQFDVLTVSFDPREKPELAAGKKQAYLQRYGRKGAESGWHFLTGDSE